jgi:3-methylcrotonyl-CoA carboxylase alpha subunit
VERYVTRPRHIEIQVFGDQRGHYVHLFERDCSVQRRHQKVLEEAPAPAIGEARRGEMGAAAIAAARAVGYVGAGTVEFIAEPGADGELHFFFMEMNTRLQVEHPVTEAISGVDLVEWQLRIAAGEPLPLQQSQLQIHGHAIEARLCAENPDAKFLPSTGRLDIYRTPPAVEFERSALASESTAGALEPAACRLDAGVREGDVISPYYDPMIAKLIVWGRDRDEALARLDRALAQTHIVGLHTNVAFLRRVVTSPSFATADLDTSLIEREAPRLFDIAGLRPEVVAAGAVAAALDDERRLENDDPWSRRNGWRLHGRAARRFELKIQGAQHVAVLERGRDGRQTLVLAGKRRPYAAAARSAGRHDVRLGEQRWPLAVYTTGSRISVFAPGGSASAERVEPLAHAGETDAEAGRLSAPMPGKVIAFLVQPGDRVEPGQALAVMEAMKMEHTIAAPHAGTVEELLYAVGDQVDEGGELLRLATP